MGSQTPTSEIIVLKTANSDDTHDTCDATPAIYLDNWFVRAHVELTCPQNRIFRKAGTFLRKGVSSQ